jgi:uncharacterized protein
MRDADALDAALAPQAKLAIAVSGGVDSMTLAHFVHARSGTVAQMIHATSPAVPAAATARVRAHAARHGWNLTVTDAGEFADPRYRANPVDRCYFCKTNLYDRIRGLTSAPIASGANLDDLDDYRPGLVAAGERGVLHPFIAAGFTKAAVRALARAMALDDLAELPAQPCLSSRIETAIPVRPDDLAFIESMEQQAAALLPAATTLRCRITRRGVVIEIGAAGLTAAAAVASLALTRCAEAGQVFAGVRPYVRGSAFVHET